MWVLYHLTCRGNIYNIKPKLYFHYALCSPGKFRTTFLFEKSYNWKYIKIYKKQAKSNSNYMNLYKCHKDQYEWWIYVTRINFIDNYKNSLVPFYTKLTVQKKNENLETENWTASRIPLGHYYERQLTREFVYYLPTYRCYNR